MRAMMRGLGRLVLVAALVGAVAAVVVAVGRAALGRFAGEPGAPAAQRGSFDTWPTVPPAPGRLVANGSQVPAGS